MKNRIIVLAAAAVLAGGLAWAHEHGQQAGQQQPQQPQGQQGQQGQQSQRKMGQAQAERLKEQLGLSDEQTEQVRVVLAEFMEKNRDLRPQRSAEGEPPTPEERAAQREKFMEERKKAREEKDARLKEILTPEQWEKYQTLAGPRQMKREGAGEHPQGKQEHPQGQKPPQPQQ